MLKFLIASLAWIIIGTPGTASWPAGAWTGKGSLMGKPAVFELCWVAGPHPGLVRLEYLAKPDNGPVFKAAAFFHSENGNNTYAGKWFDSRPAILDLEASHDSNRWETNWRNNSEKGRSDYTLSEDRQTMTVRDFVMRDGREVQFANASYSPSPACRI